ncbi:hypothetical protein BGX34_001564, partial [Mortierella sp. NVP85]
MVFGSVISSPRGNLTLQQALELANIYLDHAGKAQDVDISLVFCHDTEVSLLQAGKAAKHVHDQTMRYEIATRYIRLGRVLAIRGHRSEAQAIYKKAEKLGVKIQDFGHPTQPIGIKRIAPSLKSTTDSVEDTQSTKTQPEEAQSTYSLRESNKINAIATIPDQIFAENVHRPTVVAKLPEPDERLIDTPQLA